MKLPSPSFLGQSFFGLRNPAAFVAARDAIIAQVGRPQAFFASDNLITWEKTLGFLRDDAFATAINKNTRTGYERASLWRVSTLVWAAKQASHLDGDFVECACYRGNSARTVADLVDISNRRYFLYDLFEHDETMPHHAMPEHSRTLFDEVRARFPEPNVVITQGRVPDSLALASPERIAFMHLDLNNADAEIAALEILWDRILPGGVLVLDDFGWAPYQAQYVAETKWLGDRGHVILEMPTGQGLVIKHA